MASVCSIGAALCVCAQSNGGKDYEIEARDLADLAKFVDWPEKSFATPQSPFTVCVLGHDPFGPALDMQFLSKTIENRTLQLIRFPVANELAVAARCQIAFISSSENYHFREVIDSFRGQSVLLVGDGEGFAAAGGMVEFVCDGNRIRFAINPDAADRAELRVSSKLLALATIVHDDAGKGKS